MRVFLACLTLVMVVLPAAAMADIGDPDPTFGVDGTAYSYPPAYGSMWEMQLDSEGRLVVAGHVGNGFNADAGAVRFTGDGNLDLSYGDDGVARVLLEARPYAMALDAEDRMILVGRTEDARHFVTRALSDGSVDESFGVDGAVLSERGSVGSWLGVVIDDAGRIVVAGEVDNVATIIRLTDSGELDTTFGDGGVLAIDAPAFWAIATTPVGYVVALTERDWEFVNGSVADIPPAAVAVDVAGAVDVTFGDEGRAAVSADEIRYLNDLFVDASGRIYVTGEDEDRSLRLFAARFTAGGVLDAAFGDGGTAWMELNGATGLSEAIAVSDEHVYVALGPHGSSSGSAYVGRFDLQGEPDPSWGNGGLLTLVDGTWRPRALRFDGSGHVLVGALGFHEDVGQFMVTAIDMDAAAPSTTTSTTAATSTTTTTPPTSTSSTPSTTTTTALASTTTTLASTTTTTAPASTTTTVAETTEPTTPSEPVDTPPTPFTDVDASVFARDIEELHAAGIVKGCTQTLFCPDDPVTRGQMAALLSRALNLPGGADGGFVDVSGSVFERDIYALAGSGITRGCASDRFCPEDLVTRGQMAAFLRRAFGLPAGPLGAFSDDDLSVFEPDIEALAAAGITSGCAPNSFCPDDVVTRGQMVAFLNRALKRMG